MNNEKSRLIIIDNNYFEVVLNKSGFSFNPISGEDYLSKVTNSIVLGDASVVLEEDNLFQKIINETQDSLKKTLESDIKNIVLSILGFEKDSGRNGYKVDHCNARMSSVIDLISAKLKNQLLNVELDQDFALTMQEKIELKEVMRQEFVRNYKYKMERLVSQEASSLAEKHVREYIAELVANKTKDITDSMMNAILTKEKK
jgi:hypothetical protein